MAKRRPRRKVKSLATRVAALEKLVLPKRARASKSKQATSEGQYLGAYRVS